MLELKRGEFKNLETIIRSEYYYYCVEGNKLVITKAEALDFKVRLASESSLQSFSTKYTIS